MQHIDNTPAVVVSVYLCNTHIHTGLYYGRALITFFAPEGASIWCLINITNIMDATLTHLALTMNQPERLYRAKMYRHYCSLLPPIYNLDVLMLEALIQTLGLYKLYVYICYIVSMSYTCFDDELNARKSISKMRGLDFVRVLRSICLYAEMLSLV